MIASMIGIAFDCPDAAALADFYARLTGWKKEIEGEAFAALRTPQGVLIVFQAVESYEPPVWPWETGRQGQMAHIDYMVDSLPEAEAHALACGATKASVQYYDTSTVMLDPAGHPFCLSTVQQ